MTYLIIYLSIGFLVGIYIIMGHLSEYKSITVKAAASHMLLGIMAGPVLAIMFLLDEYVLPKKK